MEDREHLALRFKESFEAVDPVVHVLLKGHLLLEELMGEIIEQHLFHPKHLSDARLTFSQKISLCRSLCLRKNDLGEWALISVVNTLRNDLAHRLQSEVRAKKIEKVRNLYFQEAAENPEIDNHKKEQDQVVLAYACVHCGGFLGSFLEDAKRLRALLHRIDRNINPNAQEFEL
jgi:hypothetical protein